MEAGKIETDASSIYRAQDLELNRDVCVKKVEIGGENPREVQRSLEKAMLEVRAMVEISDKSIYIPSIYSSYFNEKDSSFYIIMQWIHGDNLSKKMDEPEIRFVNWMIDLCDILISMEASKLYHRDIKPENIMIDSNNELFLIDFNISVATPNLIEGTPHYKAPEMDPGSKYMGREKVDIFAIGVILYQYYTGCLPKRSQEYARNTSRGKFQWDVFVQPLEKNPEMPKLVNDIILRCMKLDPKERYANNRELKRELVKAERSLRNGRKGKRDPRDFF